MNKQIGFVFTLIVLAATVGLLLAASNPEARLKQFSSNEELASFLKASADYNRGEAGGFSRIFAPKTAFATTMVAEASTSTATAADYSTTNVQVEGVDEADIVKNDGKYIYMVTGNKVVIVEAYPADTAKVVSEIALPALNRQPTQIFVNGNRLAVFSQGYADDGTATSLDIYDISNREKPILARSVTVKGNYAESRMIGNHVYAVITQPVYYNNGPVPLPAIAENGNEEEIPAQEIYYFDYPDYGYNYVNIVSVNIQNDEPYNSKTFLGGSTQNTYVSEDSIYLARTVYKDDGREEIARAATGAAGPVGQIIPVPPTTPEETTAVEKITVNNGEIKYGGKGEVPGHVLNQFSMDEHNGYFRIATTIGEVWRGGSSARNNVYVLDEQMKTVGAVENLAPGEKIYSARFMGNRAYLVTFKKVDPLFVIDLSEPTSPKVLGKLKIPGYSDYLHPYDENHIIGLGKDAVEAEEGDFAWYNSANGGMYKRDLPALYQGLKLALFDVSDPENPKEVSKYAIGDRGTDSYALQDHKAFLFSRDKNLLVIPVLLAEIDENRFAEGSMSMSANAYGRYVWQGAYVFNLDAESGFQLKGRVSHMDGDEGRQQMLRSGYYSGSDYSVKRSLYMDDVLYTLSDRMIKMNGLDDLAEINSVGLQNN